MASKRIETSNWPSYFDRISRAIEGNQIDVEISGEQPETGDLAGRTRPLFGVAYDAEDNVVMITAEGGEHLIRDPLEVCVDEENDALRRLEIVDAQGQREVIDLKSPLELCEPRRGAAPDYAGLGEPTD